MHSHHTVFSWTCSTFNSYLTVLIQYFAFWYDSNVLVDSDGWIEFRKNRLNPNLVLKNASKFDKILRELKEVLELVFVYTTVAHSGAETFIGQQEKRVSVAVNQLSNLNLKCTVCCLHGNPDV